MKKKLNSGDIFLRVGTSQSLGLRVKCFGRKYIIIRNKHIKYEGHITRQVKVSDRRTDRQKDREKL